VEYYFSDHLKSTDIVTNATGGIVRESDYVPYGGEVVISGTDPNRYKFIGKERDPESGLDDFDARFYSSPFGRFMTPDWEAKPTDVPYANFGNPQSLNLYSYVQNNPTTVGDPDGHVNPVTDIATEISEYIAAHPAEVQAVEAEAARVTESSLGRKNKKSKNQ
jgi:RHS repeat-associated protein